MKIVDVADLPQQVRSIDPCPKELPDDGRNPRRDQWLSATFGREILPLPVSPAMDRVNRVPDQSPRWMELPRYQIDDQGDQELRSDRSVVNPS